MYTSSISTAPLAATPLPAGASSTPGTATGGGTSPVPSRDSSVADLASLTASMNLLAAQAASPAAAAQAQTAEAAITLPALPAMPAPQAPAAVPTDDHGASNVVFADADADGSLIH
jgi:hypothetical protein